MGWRASLIIIKNAECEATEPLLCEMGFTGLAKQKDEPFEIAIYPEDNKVYIGRYKNNIIICDAFLPADLFDDDSTPAKSKLSELFPHSDIFALMLQSTTAFWAYSLTRNGKLVRGRSGTADEGVSFEAGEPLEEEREMINSALIIDGERHYKVDGIPEEMFSEGQMGESFVFAISKARFGVDIEGDDSLFETMFEGYSYGDEPEDKGRMPPAAPDAGKPFWKFW